LNIKNYIFPVTILVLITLGLWIFWKVLLYLIVSLVLFLIGSPLTARLKKIKIGKKGMSNALAATITLIAIFGLLCSVFVLILPPLIDQIDFMSKLNFYDVVHDILNLYPSLSGMLEKLGSEDALKTAINGQFETLFNFDNVSLMLNNVFSYLADILGGLFCVIFITFFFLKDKATVSNVVMLIVPQKYENETRDIMRTSKKMLSSYFIGLVIDIIIVGTLAGLTLWICGIKNALIIGFMAGLFNVVPYLGPIITLCFALFMGVSGCIELGQYDLISGTITKVICALLSINILDAVFIQPYIFSNTVKAHPLEIFIVILMAGTIGGIGGMVVAIPVYTLIRITAKEFLSHFKFFKKLTENIKD
jgi:predicted PurR-regulated permease PerM